MLLHACTRKHRHAWYSTIHGKKITRTHAHTDKVTRARVHGAHTYAEARQHTYLLLEKIKIIITGINHAQIHSTEPPWRHGMYLWNSSCHALPRRSPIPSRRGITVHICGLLFWFNIAASMTWLTPRCPAEALFFAVAVRCTAVRRGHCVGRARGCRTALDVVIFTGSSGWEGTMAMTVLCFGGMCAFRTATRCSMGARSVHCTPSARCVRRWCRLVCTCSVATPFEVLDAASLNGFEQLLSCEPAFSPGNSTVSHE
jgi:hypothetical protein